MKKGAIYIRVSTDEQTEYSPDSQLKLCLKYARENNIEVSDEQIYRENGISGTNIDKRIAFKEMIANAKTKPKPFDVILIYSFSRFARNREDAIFYKSLLRKKLGIEVISITQPLTDSKESILLEALYEAMDEYYSLDLAENSIRGKLEKISRGEHLGNPPYGYIYNKATKRLEINEEEAKIVRMIFNEWIKPQGSLSGICIKLNRMGIKTSRGNAWSNRNMHIVLRNPAYIGMVRFTIGGMKRNWHHPDTKVVKGVHSPIIDGKTFELASKKLKNMDDTWFPYKKNTTNYNKENWLRGLVKCSDCGKSLVLCYSHKNTPFLQCNGYSKKSCLKSHYIRKHILEEAIVEQVKKDFKFKLNIKIKDDIKLEDDNIDLIMKELERLDIKEKRIKDAYISGIDTIEEYKDNKNNLANIRKKLTKELEDLKYKQKIETKKEKVYSYCGKAYKILSDPNADALIKYDIAHKLFDNIVFSREKGEITIIYKGYTK